MFSKHFNEAVNKHKFAGDYSAGPSKKDKVKREKWNKEAYKNRKATPLRLRKLQDGRLP